MFLLCKSVLYFIFTFFRIDNLRITCSTPLTIYNTKSNGGSGWTCIPEKSSLSAISSNGILVLNCKSELVSVTLGLALVRCYLTKEDLCCLDFGTDEAYSLGISIMYLLSFVDCIFIMGVDSRRFWVLAFSGR